MIGFSLGTYEGSVVGVISGKWMGYTPIETDELPLGWLIGPAWHVIRGKVGTPLGS